MAEQKSVKNKQAKAFQIKRNMFRSLTPQQGIDIQSYREALDFAFSKDDIRNIALSGSYGSGKSSVFNTYASQYQERKFIRISLARFEEQGKESKKSETSEDMQKTVHVLEGKILNQLLHQIPPSNIFQSNFRIKREITPKQSVLTVVSFLFFVVSLLFFILFNRWVSFVGTLEDTFLLPLLKYTTDPYVRLFWGALALGLLCIGLYRFVRTHNFQNVFKKIDVNGVVGIELFEKEATDSFFDKYLNEVIYLFEHSDADAIVFEDLDRYDVTLIFEKLREINDLIHQKRLANPKKNQKTLRFIYLIRDDIFSSSDRSKFFDFIIPIVPITDCSNSANKLMARLDDVGFKGMFSKRFLQDVSLYLSDLRLINNIVNELLIYHDRLQESSPSESIDCQFAMILYKNLFPQDYILLQQGRGYVFHMLAKKEKFSQARRDKLKAEIGSNREKLLKAEQEHLQSLDELNALFFPLTEDVRTIDGDNVTDDTTRTELVKQILANPDSVKYYKNGTSANVLNVNEKQSKMEANPDYISRKKTLENKTVTRKKQIAETIQQLEHQHSVVGTLPFHELLVFEEDEQAAKKRENALKKKSVKATSEGNEKGEENDDVWNCKFPDYEASDYMSTILNSPWFPMLKHLIRYGYINENYSAYVSYLHPGSLSTRDREFLLSLFDRKHLGFEYHLDNPSEVLDRLCEDDFMRPELFNFELLEYLFNNGKTEQISHWICKLTATNLSDVFEFLLSFLRYTQQRERFICFINQEYPHWFRQWTESGLLTVDEWKSYVLDSIYFAEEGTLHALNADGWLTVRISEDETFLQIDEPKIDLLIQGFQELQVRFSSIVCRNEDFVLLDAVYKHGLYQITFPMLKTIMTRYYDCYDADIEQRSYTCLLEFPEEPLTKYVEQNMPTYMAAILGNGTTRFTDDEPAVVALLNHKSASEEDKLSYISRLDTKVQSLIDVNAPSTWHALMSNGNIEFSWENVVSYFASLSGNDNELTSELSSFIKQCEHIPTVTFNELKKYFDDACAKKLLNAIWRSTDFSLPQYEKILCSLDLTYSNFTLTDVSSDYLVLLFKNGIIRMTANNAENMRSNYPDCFSDFVALVDANAFADLVEKEEFALTQDELIHLLFDDRIQMRVKVCLLNSTPGTISLKLGEFPAVLKAIIIQDHFDTDDIETLLKSFNKEEVEVKTAFKQYADENWDKVYSVVDDTEYISAELYAHCLTEMDLDQAERLRGYLDADSYEGVCTSRKNPSFRDTEYNRTILEFFRKQGWISSWRLNGDGTIRAYSKQH